RCAELLHFLVRPGSMGCSLARTPSVGMTPSNSICELRAPAFALRSRKTGFSCFGAPYATSCIQSAATGRVVHSTGGPSMNDLSELEKRIEARLAAQREQAEQHYNHQHERMREWDERHQRYTALADHLVADIIRPRLQKLVGKFDNAELLCGDQLGRHQCI